MNTLPNDCIQYTLNFMNMHNIINLSHVNKNMHTICNELDSIKKYIDLLPFNPYNYFKSNTNNITHYINYKQHVNDVYYTPHDSDLNPLKIISLHMNTLNLFDKTLLLNKNIICYMHKTSYTDKISHDLKTLSHFINISCCKEIYFVIKSTTQLIADPFTHYKIIFNGSELQTIHYNQIHTLCADNNIYYKQNGYTLKNGIYKYKIPIIYGGFFMNCGVFITRALEIHLNTQNNALIKDIYIKTNELSLDTKYVTQNNIFPFIATKLCNILDNKIIIPRHNYPIKLYFYFNQHILKFKTLKLKCDQFTIEYNYDHIQVDENNHFCLNFIDKSINVYTDFNELCKCAIRGNFEILFDDIKLSNIVTVYMLYYDILVYMNGSSGFIYSN